LRLRKVKKEGVAVIKFGVNEREGWCEQWKFRECFLSFEYREYIGSKIYKLRIYDQTSRV